MPVNIIITRADIRAVQLAELAGIRRRRRADLASLIAMTLATVAVAATAFISAWAPLALAIPLWFACHLTASRVRETGLAIERYNARWTGIPQGCPPREAPR